MGSERSSEGCPMSQGPGHRHDHASWLLARDSDLKSVTARLGHAQIQTTQQQKPRDHGWSGQGAKG